jgi:hypothetical protein
LMCRREGAGSEESGGGEREEGWDSDHSRREATKQVIVRHQVAQDLTVGHKRRLGKGKGKEVAWGGQEAGGLEAEEECNERGGASGAGEECRQEETKEERWECKRCTLVNDIDQRLCLACEAAGRTSSLNPKP